MKIVVLGACADMAKPILPILADEDGVERVVLADIAEERVRALAAGLGPRYEAVRTDATDPTSLVAAVRGAGVVLGYVGPFYRFEAPIAEACIQAGVHYVSIADDYDAYLAVSALHDRARAAGVTVVTGLGNSPGLTNLLAKKGYRSMDRPDRIHIAWTGGSDESVGPANVLHVMHIFEGETIQWRDGREVRVRCGEGEKEVEFPEPIGRQTVFYTGHAESVSVPRNLPGLSEVTLHGGIRPVWVARLAAGFGRLGLTTTHERRRAVARVLAPVMDLFKLGGSADRSVFRIDVHGTHRCEPRHHWYEGVGRIAEITSFPLLEGALMVARGEVSARGVLAAEAAFDPDDFLPRVERRGVTLRFHEGGVPPAGQGA
jgi:saccharopine dehydrogenase-like NADP-dependent oxidoreductase